MDQVTVIKILKLYKNVDKEIQFINRIKNDIEDNYYNPIVSINNASATYGTEKQAINIPEEIKKELEGLQKQKKELEEIKKEVITEINKLETIHKKIVYDFYIDDMQWQYIAHRVNYSIRQCKNLRSAALEKLRNNFDANEKIKQYKIVS